jgi:thiamine-phosphate pyrophosphorylase
MNVEDAPPRLIVITDTTVAPRDVMEARIARLLAVAPPRSVLVQLRDNALPFRERRSLGERLAAECARREQWFGVNDRADLAVLLGAHALHLGERSVDAVDARRLVPPGTWISRACHDDSAVSSADADAVLLSPIVEGRKGAAALGIDALSRVRRRIGVGGPRLYALGGVDAGSAAACFAAGADGVAVIGAALRSDDPAVLLAALV